MYILYKILLSKDWRGSHPSVFIKKNPDVIGSNSPLQSRHAKHLSLYTNNRHCRHGSDDVSNNILFWWSSQRLYPTINGIAVSNPYDDVYSLLV